MKRVLWAILGILIAVPAAAQDDTPAHAEPPSTHAGTVGYGRLGYGRVLGSDGAGNPALGFGFRAEKHSLGIDISFLNYQLPSSGRNLDGSSGTFGGSLLKLEGLYFLKRTTNASAYVGAGMSWGAMSAYRSARDSSASAYSSTSWDGSGLQGELTAGYELGRTSEMRMFVQADATLPFYAVVGETYSHANGHSSSTLLGRRYNPSMVMSLGLGWQRRHW